MNETDELTRILREMEEDHEKGLLCPEGVLALKYSKIIQSKPDNIPQPTEPRISTQSAACKLSGKLNIVNAASVIESIIREKKSPHIIRIEYKNAVVGEVRNKKKRDIDITKLANKTRFYNQITVVIKPRLDAERYINVKYFLNAAISLTGCEQSTDGLNSIKILLDSLKEYPDTYDGNINEIEVLDYRITMINSDFCLNFKVNRSAIYNICLKTYGMYVAYDPTNYPGVKISYMWSPNGDKSGICKCPTRCKLEKLSRKKNICKIITISVFQSGNVIITGANDPQQTTDAYNYINSVIKNHFPEIIRYTMDDIANMDINISSNNQTGETEIDDFDSN